MALKDKKQFVAELNDTIIKYQGNVESIRYDIFQNTEDGDWVREFLVINYVGGCRTIRPCTGNSYSAIFKEISDHLDHGRYDCEDYYAEFVNDPENWKLI